MGWRLALACCLLVGCSLDREPIPAGNLPVVSGAGSAGMAADADGEDSQSLAGTGGSAAGNSPSGTAGASSAGTAATQDPAGAADSGASGSASMLPDAGPADAGTRADASPAPVDAGAPLDFYGMCSDDSQCLDQALCLRSDAPGSGSSWGGWRDRSGFSGMPAMSVCSPRCASAIDCPPPLDTGVAVTCYVGSCILDCTAGAACPAGATCIDADFFGPAPALCLWPLP